MDLSRFNKWTQYLKRDILLETLRAHRDFIESAPDPAMYAIVRNPNFDLPRYAAAFPGVNWALYATIDPMSPDELGALTEMFDPETHSSRCGEIEMEHAVHGLFEMLTEQQIRDMKFDIVYEYAKYAAPGRLDAFVGRPDIPIDIIASVLNYMSDTDDTDVELLAEIADRKDLTPEIAKHVYELAWKHDPRMRFVMRRLAYNSALSLDDVRSIYGVIPEIALNQEFEPHYIDDSRMQKLFEHITDGNCNFVPSPHPHMSAMFMNPRFDGSTRQLDDLGEPGRHLLLVKNQFTKHPVWRAKCQQFEADTKAWVNLTWNCLTERLPAVLAEMILEAWYDAEGCVYVV